MYASYTYQTAWLWSTIHQLTIKLMQELKQDEEASVHAEV